LRRHADINRVEMMGIAESVQRSRRAQLILHGWSATRRAKPGISRAKTAKGAKLIK